MFPVIAFEGIDASGKATQSKRIAEAIDAERFEFPNYETATGDAIKHMLRTSFDWGAKREAVTLQALNTINRLEAEAAIVKAAGELPVVLDRYYASGLVYGLVDGLDEQWLWQIHRKLYRPQLYILLDIPVEKSFERRPGRLDRYERDREFLRKVRTTYLELWLKMRGLPGNWVVVDGTKSEDEVFETCMELIHPLLTREALEGR